MNGGTKPKPIPKHTQPRPQPGMAALPESQTQTQAPHNSRKPSVHSRGTETARAMQVARPKVTPRPGVRLHPKSCAALGLQAERALPTYLSSSHCHTVQQSSPIGVFACGTPVGGTQDHSRSFKGNFGKHLSELREWGFSIAQPHRSPIEAIGVIEIPRAVELHQFCIICYSLLANNSN